MRTLILTTALVLVSLVSALAQEARPGSPIGGIVVKGGQNPRPKGFEINEEARPGQPIGGIVVKGGQNPRPQGSSYGTVSPLYDDGGHHAENPMAIMVDADGNPIGGIIVKGGSNGGPQALATNPLYTGSGTQGSNPLYKGDK